MKYSLVKDIIRKFGICAVPVEAFSIHMTSNSSHKSMEKRKHPIYDGLFLGTVIVMSGINALRISNRLLHVRSPHPASP